MIVQSPDELEKSLSRDASRQVYLILGPELYQCQRALDMVKSKFLSPDSMAFDYAELSGGVATANQILEAANTFPVISMKRLVLVSDAAKLKDGELDALLDGLSRLSLRCVLIFFAEEYDHRKKFYRVMREKHCVAEFPKLKGLALEQWAASFIQRRGYRCPPSAVKRIVDLAGANLQMLAAELEKLVLFAGKQKDITDLDVEELIGGSRQQSIFDFIGAVEKRDRNAALRSLANILSMGEYPLVVVTMLARYCRQVLIAKEFLGRGMHPREIGSAAQIPPFMLDAFLRQTRAVDAAAIRKICVRLADLDRRLKSTSADGRLLLENLICSQI